MAGEPLVQRDAEREQVARGVGLGALPLLGVDVARRAGMQLPLGRAFAARQRHAQVEDAPAAVVAQVQVAGLDVAVHHAMAMQPAQGLGHFDGRGNHFGHCAARAGLAHLLQRAPAVPVEHDVERAGVLGAFVHAHESVVAHALAQPGFVREHRALLRVAGARGMQRLERHQFARGRIARLVQQVHAGVGHQRGDDVAVERVAHLQQGRRRQAAAVAEFVVELPHIEADDADDQRGRVVARACVQRRLHQRLARLLGTALQGERGQALRLEHAVHAIGAEHEAIAHAHVALRIVDAHLVVQADGARQPAAHVGMLEGVVLGQRHGRLAAGAHAPGARVAHMRERVALAVQHQRRQRGERGGAALPPPVVVGEPGVLRGDQAVERGSRLPGIGRREVVGEEAHDGGLRRLQAAPARGHAIGNGRDEPARLVAGRRVHGAREVFVHVARSALAAVADVHFKAHGAILHMLSARAVRFLCLIR